MECVDKNKQTKKRCDCSVTQYAYVALQACFSLKFMFLLQIMQENNVFC